MAAMIVLTIVNAITSLSMILGGWCMKDYADKPGDHSIGYRSKRAVSSNEAWKLANTECGDIWMKGGTAGLILTLCGIVVFLINNYAGNSLQVVVLTLMTAAMIGSAIIVEKKLKNRFGNNK
ncbi:MAG: SdpI family protein [Ruminococcus sp.]|nr:SdpI family protein [Ruminococcus sp.]